GQRIGVTPFGLRLEAGEYWMTASAEYVSPLMQTITVEAGREKAILLPVEPVTTENYARVGKWVMEEITRQPENSHLYIIALYLTTDPGEAQKLLGLTDQRLPGDPIVEILRAKILNRAGRPEEA